MTTRRSKLNYSTRSSCWGQGVALLRLVVTVLWLMMTTLSVRVVDGYKFGLLVKTFNNEFFLLAQQGCDDFARMHNSTCVYRGPLPTDEVPNPDPDGHVQANMLLEMLETDEIDALAISVKGPDAIGPAIQRAVDEYGIPVVTFDSDAPNSKVRRREVVLVTSHIVLFSHSVYLRFLDITASSLCWNRQSISRDYTGKGCQANITSRWHLCSSRCR